jgi:hypothetical protein
VQGEFAAAKMQAWRAAGFFFSDTRVYGVDVRPEGGAAALEETSASLFFPYSESALR